jgi:transposase
LYVETDAEDGFREPGFSKERRLEPQITIGLLTDASGFPLAVEAFKGHKSRDRTMLPLINAFKAAHHLTALPHRHHPSRQPHPDPPPSPQRRT